MKRLFPGVRKSIRSCDWMKKPSILSKNLRKYEIDGFCVLVYVHEMAINHKVQCKQYANTEKNTEVREMDSVKKLWYYRR